MQSVKVDCAEKRANSKLQSAHSSRLTQLTNRKFSVALEAEAGLCELLAAALCFERLLVHKSNIRLLTRAQQSAQLLFLSTRPVVFPLVLLSHSGHDAVHLDSSTDELCVPPSRDWPEAAHTRVAPRLTTTTTLSPTTRRHTRTTTLHAKLLLFYLTSQDNRISLTIACALCLRASRFRSLRNAHKRVVNYDRVLRRWCVTRTLTHLHHAVTFIDSEISHIVFISLCNPSRLTSSQCLSDHL